MVDAVASAAVEQGYARIFLATLDAIDLAEKTVGIELLGRSKAKVPDGYILANRGFDLLAKFLGRLIPLHFDGFKLR